MINFAQFFALGYSLARTGSTTTTATPPSSASASYRSIDESYYNGEFYSTSTRRGDSDNDDDDVVGSSIDENFVNDDGRSLTNCVVGGAISSGGISCSSSSEYIFVKRKTYDVYGSLFYVDNCCDFNCRLFAPIPILLFWLVLFVSAAFVGALIMFKVLKSYSKKAERRHEITRGSSGVQQTTYSIDGSTNGSSAAAAHHHHMMSMQGGTNGAAVIPVHGQQMQDSVYVGGIGGGFSESSAFEAHEHYERKVQRVKRSRADRDRAAGRRMVEKRIGMKVIFWRRASSGKNNETDKKCIALNVHTTKIFLKLKF